MPEQHIPHGQRRLRVIGAASGIGAQDKRCEDGPQAFHRSQVWQELSHLPAVDWGRTLYPPAGEPAPIPRIAALCRQLAGEVTATLAAQEMPLVLGGDHSIAIGTWSGVARHLAQPVGLLWIDAHLDSHTPESTYSGAVHGMPLACLLGQGDKRLLDLGLRGPQVDARHAAVLGARSYEPEELAFLQRAGVRIFAQEEIAERGFPDCLDEAMSIVAGAPAGFGLTLDLDAIDPQLAPGVGSPEADGLAASDVLTAIAWIVGFPGLRAVEIVEFNPDRDRFGRTAQLIGQIIQRIVQD